MYRNIYTGEIMPQEMWQNFSPQDPNGGTAENCLISEYNTNTTMEMHDAGCSDDHVGLCNLTKMPLPKMRGQNSIGLITSQLDHNYRVAHHVILKVVLTTKQKFHFSIQNLY